jgi:hypothetical protein
VIEGNERLREYPGHEESAAARISEGEQELATLDAQIAAIEHGEPLPPPLPGPPMHAGESGPADDRGSGAE